MRAFITGGAGFIGSHLAERLLAQGNEVWVMDDLSTGSMENIKELCDNPRFHFRLADILNWAIGELWEVEHYDVIFHLAGAVGVRRILDSPLKSMEINLRATEIILALAAKRQKLVVLASSSEVYGNSTKERLSESDELAIGSPTQARWSYACAKAMGEFLALAYRKERGLPVIVARLFNTVGPRQSGRYGMVLPTFVRQALAHEPLTVFGTGEQSRCFAYVGDVVADLSALARNSECYGEIFNVGSHQEIIIEELARAVIESTGSSSRICHIPYERAYLLGYQDIQRRKPSLAKIERFLGYRAETPLKETIHRVVEYEKAAMNELAVT